MNRTVHNQELTQALESLRSWMDRGAKKHDQPAITIPIKNNIPVIAEGRTYFLRKMGINEIVGEYSGNVITEELSQIPQTNRPRFILAWSEFSENGRRIDYSGFWVNRTIRKNRTYLRMKPAVLHFGPGEYETWQNHHKSIQEVAGRQLEMVRRLIDGRDLFDHDRVWKFQKFARHTGLWGLIFLVFVAVAYCVLAYAGSIYPW